MHLKRFVKIAMGTAFTVALITVIALAVIAVEQHIDNVANAKTDSSFVVSGLYQGLSRQTRVVFFVPGYFFGRWSRFWDSLHFTSVEHTWFCVSHDSSDPGQCYAALGRWYSPEPQRGRFVQVISSTGSAKDVQIRDVATGYVFTSNR